MRAATFVFASLLLAGCNPSLDVPLQAATASLTGSGVADDPTTASTCVGICDNELMPRVDPWNGQKGYVIFAPVSYGPGSWLGRIGIVGVDATFSRVLWSGMVATQDDVTFFQNLPETIPFQCGFTADAGQVGAGDTKTGGNNDHCSGVCFTDASLKHLGTCLCTPQTPATACNPGQCGDVSDGCGGTISCGGCAKGRFCDSNGQCRPASCHPRTCGKGNYFDPDLCSCVHGLPI